jgi:hypothetical protein
MVLTCPAGSVPMGGSWQTIIKGGIFNGTVQPGMNTVVRELYSGQSWDVAVINERASDTVTLTGYLNCWQGTYN